MRSWTLAAGLFFCLALHLSRIEARAENPALCLECHIKIDPQQVDEWLHSRHGQSEVGCQDCHGSGHSGSNDVSQARLPVLDACARCHPAQAAQFQRSRHAQAWMTMKAMPALHVQPAPALAGTNGCAACHQIGLCTSADLTQARQLDPSVELASCSACHARHRFSKADAQKPRTCAVCHAASEHPEPTPETTATPRVRTLLQQNGFAPPDPSAPTCQKCHLPEGDHGVQTAWGLAETGQGAAFDKLGLADRAVILQALGVREPSPASAPTNALGDSRRQWQQQRARMLGICGECHTTNYARLQLEAGDRAVRQADHLMAEGIRVVAGLYRDGILTNSGTAASSSAAMLPLGRNISSPVELKLFAMYLGYRMQPVRGTFHVRSNDALWNGWSELNRDLADIKFMALELREKGTNAPAGK